MAESHPVFIFDLVSPLTFLSQGLNRLLLSVSVCLSFFLSFSLSGSSTLLFLWLLICFFSLCWCVTLYNSFIIIFTIFPSLSVFFRTSILCLLIIITVCQLVFCPSLWQSLYQSASPSHAHLSRVGTRRKFHNHTHKLQDSGFNLPRHSQLGWVGGGSELDLVKPEAVRSLEFPCEVKI